MQKSPWSYYGRVPEEPDAGPQRSGPDTTLDAERDAKRTHEQLTRYLQRTLQEYSNIRAGEDGYRKIVDDALKPPPRPESVEETLRRLAGKRRRGSGRAPKTR